MINNYQAISNMAKKLGFKWNGLYNWEAIDNDDDMIQDSHIIPISEPLYDLDQTIGMAKSDIDNPLSEDDKKRGLTVYKQDKPKYDFYKKFYKNHGKCYVFSNIEKTKQGQLPTATDFKNFILNYEKGQVKALKSLVSYSQNVSKKTDGLTEDDNQKLGKLAINLRNRAIDYSNKYQDFAINTNDTFEADMVETVDDARDLLGGEIGEYQENPQNVGSLDMGLVSQTYSKLENDYDSDDWIENRGNDNGTDELQLLQPDTVGQVADDTVDEAKNKIYSIMGRVGDVAEA